VVRKVLATAGRVLLMTHILATSQTKKNVKSSGRNFSGTKFIGNIQ